MYLLSLGGWCDAGGSTLVRERIYLRGYIWTPIVRARWRYEFWQWISHRLPRKALYHAVITATALVSSWEQFQRRDVSTIPAMDIAKALED